MARSQSVPVVCAASLGAACASGALGSYTVSTETLFAYGNETFHNMDFGVPVAPGSVLPGASGSASAYDQTYANGSYGFTISSAAVQDYLTFRGRASAEAHRTAPSGGFEYFQSFATGKFIETLTIPAPAGVTPGSVGTIQPGCDVTGSSSEGASGSSYLYITAHTFVPLSPVTSNTIAIHGDGHFDVVDPIKFFYDTPFEIMIDTTVFAGVGYDYTSMPGPAVFSDIASADFLHTAILTSAIVRDSFGTVHPDAVINTSSGLPFPYEVPAPGTITLAAFAGVVGARRRRLA